MADNTVDAPPLSDEEDKVFQWRLARFMRAGFDPDRAEFLALCPLVDIGVVEAMVEAGCPHELVLGIVT